jgi:hypothetical protein
MAIIASKYYPISDIFFRDGGVKPVNLIPGEYIIHHDEPYITGLHIFNWSPTSWLTVETVTGQVIRFPATSLVEGAIYYLKINKLCDVGPNSTETQVMGISTSERI